jgi:hypothetical protein
MTLQREEPTQQGSNQGVLTLGGLPSGVSNDSLTWVPVKHYPTEIAISGHLKNFTVPTSLMNAVSKMLPTVPLRLEVPIDGLYVNGQMLLNSSDTPDGNLTALLDSVSDWLFCSLCCAYLIASDPQGNDTNCESCYHSCCLVNYGNQLRGNE